MAVRTELVELILVDKFSSRAARAGASAQLMGTQFDRVSGASTRGSKGVESFRKETDKAVPSIDKLSGRLGLAVRAVGALGPALAPVATASTAALAGLAAQASAVALGAGVMVTAFQGVGDALKAVNKARLEPTAANIDKARIAMEALSPAARKAVRAMQEWRPLLTDIRDAAAGGFFPGFVSGLERLEVLAPRVESLFEKVGDAAGGTFDGWATGLSGPEGQEFISFLEREAAPTLREFGEVAGNVAAGAADLMMAMDPVTDLFSDGMVGASERFARWADNLSKTEGYAEFIDYVRETGPQVMETIGSFADALLQVGEAASPLGGPVLQALELVADAIAAIADSPLGPTIMAGVTAMSALSLATRAYGKVAQVSWMQAARGTQGYIAQMSAVKTGAKVAGIGAAALTAGLIATENGLSLNNTAMLAGVGLMAGPWGAAAGAAAGFTMDLADAMDEGATTADEWRQAIGSAGDDVERLRAVVAELQEAASGDDGAWWRDILTDSKSEMATEPLKEAKEALDAATLSAKEFASASGIAGASFTEMANSFLRANEILSGRASLRTFEAAIDAATQAIKDNGRTLDINTEKGRKNQDALDAIAGSAIKAAETLRGTDRIRVLTQAREDFIRTAVAMRMPRKAAEALADQLGLLDRTHAKPRVSMDTSRAMAAITSVFARMADLDGTTATTYVKTVPLPGAASLGGAASANNQYLHSYLTGPTKKALGGPIYGPGTETSDSIPAMLSDGEYVVRAAAVRRYGVGFFDRANQMRLASGGVAGGRGRVSSGPGRHDEDEERRKSAKAIKAEREERQRAIKEARQKRIDDAHSALNEARRVRNSFAEQISGRFRSDIFAAPEARSSGWAKSMPPASDWKSRIQADIAQAKELRKLRMKLAAKGLDGAAAAALFENADIDTLREFANMSATEIAEYESLYGSRESLLEALGMGAAKSAYGTDVTKAKAALDAARKAAVPKQQRRNSHQQAAKHHRREDEPRRSGRQRRDVEINVWGDSSRDPVAMARETVRRMAFEGA